MTTAQMVWNNVATTSILGNKRKDQRLISGSFFLQLLVCELRLLLLDPTQTCEIEQNVYTSAFDISPIKNISNLKFCICLISHLRRKEMKNMKFKCGK